MGRASKSVVSNHDKIKNRFMELFETAEELRNFFNSILPTNSLLQTILKFEEMQDKDEICDTVLSYLGDNFFVYVATVRSDDVVSIDAADNNVVEINKKDYDNAQKFLSNKTLNLSLD